MGAKFIILREETKKGGGIKRMKQVFALIWKRVTPQKTREEKLFMKTPPLFKGK